jgi:hypothetical protein
MSEPPRRSWWDRNWTWFVPVGCLSLLVAAAAFVAVVAAIVSGAMTSSEPYAHALAEAKASPAVAEALGTPLEPGFFASGSIHVTGPSGTAALAIPLSGPKGKGTIYVEATKSAGVWTYETLLVRVKGSDEAIDLLGAGPEPAPAPAEDAPATGRMDA